MGRPTVAALITGGAKRLGGHLALTLARTGYAVAIHYGGSRKAADALAATINAEGGMAATICADLTDATALDGLVGRAAVALGMPLSVLVNNASPFDYDRPSEPDPAIHRNAIGVNLAAPMSLAAQLSEQLPAQTTGAVVNLLDQKLWNMNPDFYSYTTSKAGLLAATQMMDQDPALLLRVNAIAPGIHLPNPHQDAAAFDKVASRNPLKRPIAIDDIAHALLFLLNTPSVRGQVLHIDNGERLVPSARDVMFFAESTAD